MLTIGKLVVEDEGAHIIPTDLLVPNEEPPPIPAKYSTVSHTHDDDTQEYIQQSTGLLSEPEIPPKLPPKAYTHQ